MHRLYSASRPKSAAKIIKTISHNAQKNQNQKRPALDPTMNKTAKCDNPSSFMFTRDVSDTCKAACQEGLSPTRVFHRYASGYALHPEKLKQILKERDGHRLCIYYDSATYKQKALELMEEQTRAISVGPTRSLSDTDVTYEHMLNCAQPRKQPRVIIDQKNEEPSGDQLSMKSIMPQLLRRRKKSSNHDTDTIEVQCVFPSQQKIMTKKSQRKIYRKRTTIMPVYLKKMQDNWSLREKVSNTHTVEQPAVQSKYVPQLLRKPMIITKSRYKHEIQKPDLTPKDDHSLTMDMFSYQKLNEKTRFRRERLLNTLDWSVHID